MQICSDFQNRIQNSRTKYCFGFDVVGPDGKFLINSQTTILMDPTCRFPFSDQIAGDVYSIDHGSQCLSIALGGGIVLNNTHEDLQTFCAQLKAAKVQAVIQPLPTDDANFISQDDDLPLPVVYVDLFFLNLFIAQSFSLWLGVFFAPAMCRFTLRKEDSAPPVSCGAIPAHGESVLSRFLNPLPP